MVPEACVPTALPRNEQLCNELTDILFFYCQACCSLNWQISARRISLIVCTSQGVIPATLFLDRADLETHELGHASLSKLIGPIVDSGNATAPIFLLDVCCALQVL